MGTQILQNVDGSLGLRGDAAPDSIDGAFIPVTFRYDPASLDQTIFYAHRRFIVKAGLLRIDSTGTDAAAVTAQLRTYTASTAVASGGALGAALDLKGAVGVTSISTAGAVLNAGTMIGCDFTGILTAAVGTITLLLAPA